MIEGLFDVGINLYIRIWAGDEEKCPFLLLHGLASNCRTWDLVAARLSARGHTAVAVDLRGHGLSDKPDGGYDFETVTTDLVQLIDGLELERPFIAGHSWGGNVALEFGARYADMTCGLGVIDGGLADYPATPGLTWQSLSAQFPWPDLAGTDRRALKELVQLSHPRWCEVGVEATLCNFETLADQTVRPWLSRSAHRQILEAIWEQRLNDLYGFISAPILVCLADDGNDLWTMQKRYQLAVAKEHFDKMRVHWFAETEHDIHVQRPRELAEILLATAEQLENDCPKDDQALKLAA